MLEAILESGALLKALVDSIQSLVEEANLVCTPDGITLQAIDSTHISLVTLRLGADGFARYRCDGHMTLGVSLKTLKKCLSLCGKGDSVTLTASGTDKDVLRMKFESKGQDRTNDVVVRLLTIEADALDIPDQDYKCVLSLPSSEFARVVREMGAIGDSVTITVSKSGVEFSTEGDDGTSSRINLKASGEAADVASEDRLVIEVSKEKFSLDFSHNYLANFAKAVVLSNTVKMSLSKENPLIVEFPLEGFGFLRFFLAPKVSEEAAEDAEE